MTVATLSVSGCEKPSPDFVEQRRIDEDFSPGELSRYLKVLGSLPEEPLPILGGVYPALPDWDRNRTLPVSELVKLERRRLDNGWDVEWLTRHHKPSRRLQRALLRENLTYEQFTALSLAVVAAIGRGEVREEQDLDAIRRTALDRAVELDRDERPFASLSPEAQYRILVQAAWITRAHRAEKLSVVPATNVERIAKHRDTLAAHFPSEVMANPFDAIVDPLEEYGVPFHGPNPELVDTNLTWSADDAFIGMAKTDREPAGSPFSPGGVPPERVTQTPR